MTNPTFQKLIDDLETAVGAWENDGKPPNDLYVEVDFYYSLRSALDTYYTEVARR